MAPWSPQLNLLDSLIVSFGLNDPASEKYLPEIDMGDMGGVLEPVKNGKVTA